MYSVDSHSPPPESLERMLDGGSALTKQMIPPRCTGCGFMHPPDPHTPHPRSPHLPVGRHLLYTNQPLSIAANCGRRDIAG